MNLRSLQVLSIAFLMSGIIQNSAKTNIPLHVGVLYNPEHNERVRSLSFAFNTFPKRESAVEVQHTIKSYSVKSSHQNLLTRDVEAFFEDADCLFDLGTKNEQVYALSSLIGIPVIMMNSITSDIPYDLTLSMMPSTTTIAKALLTLTTYYRFKDIAVVYDARQGRLVNKFQTLSTLKNHYKLTMIPALRLDDKEQTRNALKVLLSTRIKNVIFICASGDMAEVMYEALHVGIRNKEHKWIASDVDTWDANKNYPPLWGMTGLRMHLTFRGEKEAISIEKRFSGKSTSPVIYASIRDAAYLLIQVVQRLANESQWPHFQYYSSQRDKGEKLLARIKQAHLEGLTGDVAFDSQTGERLVSSGLDFANIVRNEIKKIATIRQNELTKASNAEPEWVGDFAEAIKGRIPNFTLPEIESQLIFTALIEPPFVQERNNSLEGFLIDLLEKLQEKIGFKYRINLRKDTSYSAILKELVDKEADVALAPITIKAERQEKVDFTKPFYDFKMSLIMQKPNELAINLFAFLLPFTDEVWISMIGVVLFVTVAVFAIDYTSPFGYRALAQETDEGSGDELNLFNSLWFATGSMLGQGGDNTPRSPSGRILGAAFWFFILIMISTYTANLAAFFTISRSSGTIKSLKDLVEQDKIKYGVLKGGSVATYFKESQVGLHRAMWTHMTQQNTFVNSTKHGVLQARNEKYAYITEEPYLRYWNQRQPCNTMLLNNLLEPKSYGLAMQRDSPYTTEFTVAILELREKGEIASLRKKWWDEKSECIKTETKKDDSSTASLGLENLGGVFIILLGGVICALVLLIVEVRCKRVVDYLTKSQCTSDNMDEDEPEPTENLRHDLPMVQCRPQNLPLHLPDLYEYAPESKL